MSLSYMIAHPNESLLVLVHRNVANNPLSVLCIASDGQVPYLVYLVDTFIMPY